MPIYPWYFVEKGYFQSQGVFDNCGEFFIIDPGNYSIEIQKICLLSKKAVFGIVEAVRFGPKQGKGAVTDVVQDYSRALAMTALQSWLA